MKLRQIASNVKRSAIHFFSTVFYNIFVKSENKKLLLSLKDKYRGRRCFVVCNGPSLRVEDLNKIHNNKELSIGINMVPKIYDKTSWRPDFLSVSDDSVFLPKNIEITYAAEAGLKLFDKTRYLYAYKAKGEKAYLSFNEGEYLLDNPVFDPDMLKDSPSIGTSTYNMLEFAVFLGCTEIFIIGCDMSFAANISRDGKITYNDSGNNHFYAKENDTLSTIIPIPVWQMEVAFDCAEKWSRQNGVRIYNATRGGKLESFERVDFDALFFNSI